MQFSLDMYMTAALGLLMVFLGDALRKKLHFLEAICMPAPVIGGLLFAIVNLVLYKTGILDINFDETLKTFFMTVFFTTIGFQADLQALKKGGKALIILLILSTLLIVLQNVSAVLVSLGMGVSPLLGMCTGSIPLVGGYGTDAAFGPTIEQMGFSGATAYATAATTFGIVASSLMGGPLATSLIRKFSLAPSGSNNHNDVQEAKSAKTAFYELSGACSQLVLAMGIGSIISYLISLTGLKIPAYLGAMLAAAIIRNISGLTGKFSVPMQEIDEISNISLSLFLGISMITLKLWQLADLALPMMILLAIQIILMILFVRFIIFPGMGRDYDSAIIVAGVCGFGLGATPNALANMQSVTGKYGYSEKAFLVIPLVGSLFIDFINAGIVTFFLNFLK